MKPRRRARCLTLQTLYEYDLADHDPLSILQEHLDGRWTDEEDDDEFKTPLSENSALFAQELVNNIIAYQSQIDPLVTRFAPEWPLEQIAVIDRNILRLAIYEIIVDSHTPIKVVINEAVELAKRYGSDSAPRFVNGVLGTLTESVDQLRAEILGAVLQ